ncbi:MAG: TonB-dependent receptor [Salinivirgaceae bacterium]|nr:TonB-dependent receptor [Salinivirgaceae bacterium]
MRLLTVSIAVVAIALLWAVPLLAQSDSTIHRDVEAVDVEAQMQRRAAMPVQTMSAVEIQQLGVQNVADAVRRFSGTNVKDYGGIGGLKTVSVRSLGAAHTAVSYDGVVVSDCQAGPIDIGRFDIGSVESIELAIGQSGGLLQPASAFAQAATLSISTRKPTFSQRSTEVDGHIKGGSFGYLDARISTANKILKNTALSASATFTRADGDYPYTFQNVRQQYSGRRNNSDVRIAHAEINLVSADSNRLKNSLKAYGFYSERGLPGAVILYNNQANERLWDKNFFVQDDARLRLTSNVMVRLQAKYNYSWNRYEDVDVKYLNGHRIDLNTQHEGYASVAGLWSGRLLSVSLAADVAYNTLKSNMMNNPQPRRLTLLSAANVRLTLHRFEATATLVATSTTEKVDQGGHLSDVERLAPAVSARWCARHVAARAMLKKTFRVPTFNELYYTTLGTTGLKPEDAYEANIGVDFDVKGFDFTVDLFANSIENKIVAIPTLYVWRMSNCGKVNIWGADVAASKGFSLADVELKLTGSYSYQRAIDVTDKESKLYRSQIPYTPVHSGKFAAVVQWRKYSLSATSIFSGKRYYLRQNISDNEIEPYAEFSATLSRRFALGQSTLTASLSCLNIADCQYSIVKYYPMPGRQFQLQLSFIL